MNPADLQNVPLLRDLPPAELQWLADHLEERHYEAGDITTEEGSPAEHLFIVLEGELQARTDRADAPVFIARTGEITGLLPHSRMTHYGRTVRAAVPTRVASLHKSLFDEMLRAVPELGPRLIGVMADRIRETTKNDLHHEKLAALGTLSAGLAHELNNPVSAVARSADSLREHLARHREADARVGRLCLSDEQWQALRDFEEDVISHADSCTPLDALTRSDREDELASTLDGVEGSYELAAELVDSGITADALQTLTTNIGKENIAPTLIRLATNLTLQRLASEIHESATRVSGLVQAIKEYSYMDTAAEREIDVHAGLENTLTILGHRLRQGIRVERDYDRDLPKILAHGGELNQVWTNLINNAIDAMLENKQGDKLLRIRTAAQENGALVEILDTGPGIPDDVRHRIFEPFFTTKKQGEGTGLGLDIVYRIVHKHDGDIRFESKPGRTCFQVRLPLNH